MTLYPVAEHRLANGLRVVASEDHTVPAATVVVRYDAGSRHERPGRTGLAHLFEHLTYEGSAHVMPGEYTRLMRECGAVCNGSTGTDSTVYYAYLPTGAVELAMWLEAGRMATTADRLTQELLDTQRGVVTAERHQRTSDVPFGNIGDRLLAGVYPAGHPYHHPVLGYPADLDAATLDDVRAFFRSWYTPANAVLAVTGDITPEQVFTAAERYFGPVPGADQPPRVPARLVGTSIRPSRDESIEPVPFAMIALGFRLPPSSITDDKLLACDLALRIVAGGTASRAHQLLVTGMQAAQDTGASTDPRTGGNSLGIITVTAMPGADLTVIEKALTAELDILGTHEPAEEDLAIARTAAGREVLETLADSTGRAVNLALFTAAFGDPDAINSYAARIAAITPGQVRQAAAKWLRPDAAATVITRPGEPAPAPLATPGVTSYA